MELESGSETLVPDPGSAETATPVSSNSCSAGTASSSVPPPPPVARALSDGGPSTSLQAHPLLVPQRPSNLFVRSSSVDSSTLMSQDEPLTPAIVPSGTYLRMYYMRIVLALNIP